MEHSFHAQNLAKKHQKSPICLEFNENIARKTFAKQNLKNEFSIKNQQQNTPLKIYKTNQKSSQHLNIVSVVSNWRIFFTLADLACFLLFSFFIVMEFIEARFKLQYAITTIVLSLALKSTSIYLCCKIFKNMQEIVSLQLLPASCTKKTNGTQISMPTLPKLKPSEIPKEKASPQASTKKLITRLGKLKNSSGSTMEDGSLNKQDSALALQKGLGLDNAQSNKQNIFSEISFSWWALLILECFQFTSSLVVLSVLLSQLQPLQKILVKVQLAACILFYLSCLPKVACLIKFLFYTKIINAQTRKITPIADQSSLSFARIPQKRTSLQFNLTPINARNVGRQTRSRKKTFLINQQAQAQTQKQKSIINEAAQHKQDSDEQSEDQKPQQKKQSRPEKPIFVMKKTVQEPQKIKQKIQPKVKIVVKVAESAPQNAKMAKSVLKKKQMQDSPLKKPTQTTQGLQIFPQRRKVNINSKLMQVFEYTPISPALSAYEQQSIHEQINKIKQINNYCLEYMKRVLKEDQGSDRNKQKENKPSSKSLPGKQSANRRRATSSRRKSRHL